MLLVYCFGDSIVYGSGDNEALGFPGRLRKVLEPKTKTRIFNLGFGGETSHDLLKRIESELIHRLRKDANDAKRVVIICTGCNDALKVEYENSLSQYPKRLTQIIQNVQKQPVDLIIVLGMQEVSEEQYNEEERKKLDVVNDQARIIAHNFHIEFISVREFMRDANGNLLLCDGLHPSSEGYDNYSKAILKLLKEKNYF
jgi:lysophospholipase L1-like esterase